MYEKCVWNIDWQRSRDDLDLIYNNNNMSLFYEDNILSISSSYISAETQSGLPFVLHLRQKCNLFVFSFFLVYNNV